MTNRLIQLRHSGDALTQVAMGKNNRLQFGVGRVA